ncbi:Serine/threonine protein phosphatase alpha-1 isoform, putative [Trichomonas vaginalis G3]|uniref:Serine/threonine-protein phosphatase n=1 Tax=Trichomonas vaginalis (strain ATCC PRA-98 / G3) TaxID=412133 RepID=A2FV06_TRIV3|nr:protein phosphatase 2A family, catalytic domain family [Trichomonas vaginalis G3]EAX91268.1 Serine/threonine protein phosphatase alpha-1 isoform, putative [Trichomonas vaginalis G3]KAI5491807.1 protein phosphatase 2A family, catalytic domain family [Trichomonas vaginalis G3]|eukprot:XP_001304198.1 Serine/threonine protein phosphatase alpha-1 isoform [Trichomonas vaginalis G3]
MSLKWLDAITDKLLDAGSKPPGTPAGLSLSKIQMLCKEVRKILIDQPILLELQPPLTICGDIHGQYHDLLRIFDRCKYPPQTNYLFLGDYVDRGVQSIETICLLFSYKIRYPENFFLLRGNHECSYINREFGFFDECIQQYSVTVWRMFSDVFNCLPLAAIIDDKIFCVHGGISPNLRKLDDIRALESQRPFEIPEEGLVCDLVWSDPDFETPEWAGNDRGASYVFGVNPLKKFLERFHFDLVVRGHQAVMGGYDFPFQDEQGIVTLFSAPNYCYEYDNKGATMQVDENLFCSFTVLPPMKWEEDYFVGPRPGTPPRGTEENGPTELHL